MSEPPELLESVPTDVGPSLRDALTRLAGAGRLLVCSDYDGVLAPIVSDPAQSHPLPGGLAALRALAGLPHTAVAVISGRARRDLAAQASLPSQVHLVGSHGSEDAAGVPLAPRQQALLAQLRQATGDLASDLPGVWLETKPASVVVHTRNAAADVAAAARRLIADGPAAWPGVHPVTGKEVVELAVVATHKGTAVTMLRERTGAEAVLCLGDDVTDENAFAVLAEQDVGVKVGAGRTLARFRVPDPPAAVQVLELMRGLRAHRTASTLADYTLESDRSDWSSP